MIWALLLACYTEEQFRDDFDAEVCAWKAECYQEDEDSCMEAAVSARTATPDGCSFVPATAQRCVEKVQQMECKEETSEDELGFPDDCSEVWDCSS